MAFNLGSLVHLVAILGSKTETEMGILHSGSPLATNYNQDGRKVSK